MSQYRFPTADLDHKAIIGWDPALNTFFLHVTDESKDEDDEERDVEWIGCRFGEIHDMNILLRTAKLYGEVSTELERDLYRDANT